MAVKKMLEISNDEVTKAKKGILDQCGFSEDGAADGWKASRTYDLEGASAQAAILLMENADPEEEASTIELSLESGQAPDEKLGELAVKILTEIAGLEG